MRNQSPIESVDRALRVVEYLAQIGPVGVALAELSQAVDLNKATAHRILAALRFRDYVTQTPAGDYVLGPAATQIGPQFYRDENLPELLRPALAALCEAVDELVHLGTLRGRHVVYLDKVEPQRAVRVWSAIGRASPVLSTALGRVLLAAAAVGREVVENYAPDDAALAERAWEAIEQARAAGYATERE
ncbi:MAG TPA: helix-turn-helix domain-containing protein, partial [Actinomycetales bacterium]|nr:helix-turn-helix domain-containing protein [Actinomycetales bacterium]